MTKESFQAAVKEFDEQSVTLRQIYDDGLGLSESILSVVFSLLGRDPHTFEGNFRDGVPASHKGQEVTVSMDFK